MHNKEELLKTFYTSLFEIEQKRDEIKADIQNLEEQVEIIKKSNDEARKVISIYNRMSVFLSTADKAIIEQAHKTLIDNNDLLDKKRKEIEELCVELKKLNEQIKKMVDVLYELMSKEEMEKYLKSLDGYSEEDLITKLIKNNENTRQKIYDILYSDVKTSYIHDLPNMEIMSEDVKQILKMSKEDKDELFSKLEVTRQNEHGCWPQFNISFRGNGKLNSYFLAVLNLLIKQREYLDVDVFRCSSHQIAVRFKNPNEIKNLDQQQILNKCLEIFGWALDDIEKDIGSIKNTPEYHEAIQEERKKSFYKLFGIDLTRSEQKEETSKTSIDDITKYTEEEIAILNKRKEDLSESDFKTSADDLRTISVYEPLIAKCQELSSKSDFYGTLTEDTKGFKTCIIDLLKSLEENKKLYLNKDVIYFCYNDFIKWCYDVLANIKKNDYDLEPMQHLNDCMGNLKNKIEDKSNIKPIPIFGYKLHDDSVETLNDVCNAWKKVEFEIEYEKEQLLSEGKSFKSKVKAQTGINAYDETYTNYKQLEETLYQVSGIKPREKMGQRKKIIANILQLYFELDGQKLDYDVYKKENLERFLDDVSILISLKKEERKDELTRIDERLSKLESLLYDLNQFGYFVKDISAEELHKAETSIKK